MHVTNRKSKILSFRVSDAEYQAIADASYSQGFASTSLFARSATLRLQQSVTDPEALDAAPAESLFTRLAILLQHIEEVLTELAGKSRSDPRKS